MNDSDYYGSSSLETTFACERARLVRLCAKFTGAAAGVTVNLDVWQ